MKRTVILFTLAFSAITLISAQPNQAPDENQTQIRNSNRERPSFSQQAPANQQIFNLWVMPPRTQQQSFSDNRQNNFQRNDPRNAPRQMGNSRSQDMGQRASPRSPQRSEQQATESVSINGNLTIEHGRIAVNAGDTTYLVGGLSRFVGFIDGFKAGAEVSIEGVARVNPRQENVRVLRAQSMTFNGNEYNLAPLPRARSN